MRLVHWSIAAGLVLGACACGDAETSRTVEAEAEAPSPSPAVCPEPVAARAPLGQRLGERVEEIGRACKAADPLARDTTRDAEVAGRWKGEYQYDDGRPPVEVETTLRVLDRSLSGEMSEPNSFSTYGAPRLESTITGDVFASGQVVFMKAYKSGGETHSVLYIGTLAEGGRRIEGRWRVEDLSGPFWLAKE